MALAPTPSALFSWRLESTPPPPICLRLVSYTDNLVNPCVSKFKAELARQRVNLRLPSPPTTSSSIRQQGRNSLTALPPAPFLGKVKWPLHAWMFISDNETLWKLAEWSHLDTVLSDDNNNRRHPKDQTKENTSFMQTWVLGPNLL